MWIEIYDKIYNEHALINSKQVASMTLNEYADGKDSLLFIKLSSGDVIELEGKEFYAAFIMALHGNDVDLGELGHVKPLRNSQREEVAKRMNYLDAMSDIKNTN